MTLGFITWDVHPEIFTIPLIDWPLRWYGLLFATAFILSQYIMNKIFEKEGRTTYQLDILTMYVIGGTIIGARLGHMLFYEPQLILADPLEIFKIWHGGLASHGGAIGIVLALYLYHKKTKESYLWILDRIIIVVALSSIMIRMGNLFNSEIIGKRSDLPWAFHFINCPEYEYTDGPRHPSQLYEAIYCLGLFILFYALYYKTKLSEKPGKMFGLFCILMFTQRFFMEYLKEPQVEFEKALPLDMGQFLSIPFVLIGIYFLFLHKSKPKTI